MMKWSIGSATISHRPLLKEVATALVHKGGILAVLNQPERALAAYGEVVDRCEKECSHPHAWLTEYALLKKAGLEFECHRHEAAIRTAGRVIEERRTDSRENLAAGSPDPRQGDPRKRRPVR